MNLIFYQWIKESYANNKIEWKAFGITGLILLLVYSTKPLDLIKGLIQWIFVGIGADLLVFKRNKEK